MTFGTRIPKATGHQMAIQWGDWKRGTGKRGTIKNAGVENAGLENAGPIYKDGKRGTGKHGTIIQGVENAGPLAMEHRSDKSSKTKIQFIST